MSLFRVTELLQSIQSFLICLAGAPTVSKLSYFNDLAGQRLRVAAVDKKAAR